MAIYVIPLPAQCFVLKTGNDCLVSLSCALLVDPVLTVGITRVKVWSRTARDLTYERLKYWHPIQNLENEGN